MLKSFLHYQVISKLGEGGMGVVYHARDTKLKRSVALKFLPHHISGNSTERKRFTLEAQSAAALNHPNVTQVYAIEEVEDELFIVMEYIEGQELKEAIDDGALSLDEKCTIALQIAEGTKAAHDRGIIHRDIKSRNIMLDQKGDVKIMDFGLAYATGTAHITKTGTTLGTAAYMAPEQLAGDEMDERSDIWAFGIVSYELFTGVLPFQGIYESALIYAIAEEEPIPVSERNPDIPERIDDVISLCLTKDKTVRYQQMDAILADLTASAPASIPRSKQKGSTSSRRSNLFKVTGITLAVLVLLFFIYQWSGIAAHGIPEKRYLAVLPIENIGQNAALQSICDGLGETFSFKLSELEKHEESYWVMPASEMRGEQVRSARQAHQMFGVNLAILSSIQAVEDSIRLILELVDAENVHRLDTKQVTVAGNNFSLLERKGVEAMLQMLDIKRTTTIDEVLTDGGSANHVAYEYYLKGRASLQKNNSLDQLKNAIHFFQKATEEDPQFTLAYAGLGEAFWRTFESTDDVQLATNAEVVLQQALQINEKLAPVQSLLGLVNAGRGHYEAAIEHFNRALEIDPNYTQAYRELANTYHEQGKIEKAVATYRYAIALKPQLWVGYNDLGSLYLRQGNFESAAEQFKKAIELAPQNVNAYSNLGISYHFQGKLDLAESAYQNALAIKNDADVASNLATLYYSKGLYEQAAQMYQLALQVLPDRYAIWANLASAYDLSGDKQRARDSYLTAIEKGLDQLAVNPNDAELMADLAAYYSDVEDSLTALKYIKQALDHNDSDIIIRQRAVTTYEKLGMRQEAIRWITGAMIADIESQPELESLVEDPRYLAMKEKLDENKKP